MKALVLPILAAAGAAITAISTKPPALTENWNTQQLSDHFWSEGACAADVNADGNIDVIYGPYWYEGPDFKEAHTIYSDEQSFQLGNKTIPGFEGFLSNKNAYSDNFLSFTHDFNADGRPDYLVVGFPGKESFWYENPSTTNQLWKRHTAIAITENESPVFADIDGDKQPDLLCMSEGKIGYAVFDPSTPGEIWKWKAITPLNKKAYQRYTHGMGHGDINGDGRTDILEAKGWWEQPENWDGSAPWKRHDVDLGKGGAQMFGYDVNADGRTDVITSLEAHGFGLAWFEQNADGTWTRHLLTNTVKEKGATGIAFSQPHALALADIDGNGTMDIVTGKRVWAHGPNGDPEPNEPAVIYAFLLDRKDSEASYRAEIIDDDSGIGCGLLATDINKDGKSDLVVGNKKGCYIHLRK